MTYSYEYQIRHTRPMATLATIYGFSALTDLIFRVFLYLAPSPDPDGTGNQCHNLLVCLFGELL